MSMLRQTFLKSTHKMEIIRFLEIIAIALFVGLSVCLIVWLFVSLFVRLFVFFIPQEFAQISHQFEQWAERAGDQMKDFEID